jgi:hypothetical protein
VNQFEQKPAPTSVTSETGKERSSYRPMVITLLCAVLLGGGSCFGFVATFGARQGVNPLINNAFAVAFVISVFVFLGALIWLMVAWVKRCLN